MAAPSLEICKVCQKYMDDPRILSCHHSFCLKCLESSSISKKMSMCPACKIKFQVPEGGLKDLKKNDFIEQLNAFKQSKVNCDGCTANQAVKYCADCSFNYCSTCLVPHAKIPASSKHRLQPLDAPRQGHKSNSYSTCKEHLDVMNLFCEDCKVAMCIQCWDSNHSKHKVKPMSKYVETVKIQIEESIKIIEEAMINIHADLKKSQSFMLNNETKASYLKKDIHKRGETIKNIVDSIVADLIRNVDDQLIQHQKEAYDVMSKLENMEVNLKAQIEILNQQLGRLNFENAIEISSNVPSDAKPALISHTYSNFFNFSLTYEDNALSARLRELVGSLGEGPNFNLQEQIDFDGLCTSFTLDDKGLVICSRGYVIDMLDLKERNFKPIFGLESEFFSVSDLLILNGMLFVAGWDEYGLAKVFKVELKNSNVISVLYKLNHRLSYNNILKLAKSFCGNLFLILVNRIILLSEKGKVLKTIKLPFKIYDALQLHEKCFVVVGIGMVRIINDNRKVSHRPMGLPLIVSPSLKYATCIAADDCGNIYVGCNDGFLVVFDYDLNFVVSHEIEGNGIGYKIIYDPSRHALLVLAETHESTHLMMLR